MSLKKQLERYKSHLSQAARENKHTQENRSEHQKVSKQNLYDKELKYAAENLGAEIKTFEDQFVLIRTEHLALTDKQGLTLYHELFDAVAEWQNEPTPHPLSAFNKKTEELLFFDTETTGLESGAGHMIFLIGWARVTKEGVTLKQYFLPGPGHEAAFYHHFLSDCHMLKNLVTFNGKAFDWPRVKTRHQFVKDRVPKLPAFGHFDLLHASRRLWKNELESTRLQVIEKEILGIDRAGDIPGHMAPFLYFQFLKQPKASLIQGVIEHNADDIKTLITLYIHLSKKVLHVDQSNEQEMYEIGRWYDSLGNREKAITVYEQLYQYDSTFGRKAKGNLASLYKKQGQFRDSLALYEELIHKGNDVSISIYIEAAKLLEHQFRDIDHALLYTEQALERLDKKLPQEKLARDREEIMKRAQRLLKRKLTRNSEGHS